MYEHEIFQITISIYIQLSVHFGRLKHCDWLKYEPSQNWVVIAREVQFGF